MSRETRIVAVTTVVVALTRLLAVARTPWDWDEMLFAAAVRDYDVVNHQPHPPGFPIFLAAAKLVRLLGFSDFHSLQIVVVIGAMSLFPLAYGLARELGFDFETALGGALIFVFAPNVWFYGGTALSDVPALAVLLAASMLLLRGRMISGGVMLGIAIAFRPQALLVAIVPLIVGGRVVTSALIAAAVAALSYLGAALASGTVPEFVEAVRLQEEYIRRVDSFRSPTRPPLAWLVRTFFKPIRGAFILDRLVNVAAFAGGLLTVARRFRAGWLLALMFVPLNVFSWLMLDINASSRYAVSYALLYTVLAVYAIPARLRYAGIGLVVLVFVVWSVPALNEVRTQPSPPVAAVDWVREQPQATIYAPGGLAPFTRYFLRDRNVVIVDGRIAPAGARGYFVIDAPSNAPCAVNFRRDWTRLHHIARARYFEASVTRLGC